MATKYVKAIDCAETISEKFGIPVLGVAEVLAEIPSADVVEVVRCKDCAFRVVAENIPEFKGRPAMMCGRTFRITGEDEYCKYGIRKESKHDKT